MFGNQEQQGQGAPFWGPPVGEPEAYKKPDPVQPEVKLGHEHPGALLPGNLEGIFRLAQYIHKSGMAPKDFDTVEKVFVAIVMGMELGMKPMQSIQNIAVVNGRPSVWGDMLIAQVMASGLLEELPDERFEGVFPDDDFKAVCTVKRKGEKRAVTREFSIGDAKRSKLWTKEKTPWITYPKRMLQMRARSWALRDVFSDVLKGMRIAEEEKDGGSFSELINDMVEATPAMPTEEEKDLEELLSWRLLRAAGLTELPTGFNVFVGQSADNLGVTTGELLKKVTRSADQMETFWKTYHEWAARNVKPQQRQAGQAGADSQARSDPEPVVEPVTPEPEMSTTSQHALITQRCEELGVNRTDILREFSGQGTLKNLTADQAQEIIDGLGERLEEKERKDKDAKRAQNPQGAFPMEGDGEEDQDLAALRRGLVAKGETLDKDIDAECRERFGVPVYKLERDLAEKWMAVLDEEIARVNQDPPASTASPGPSVKEAKDQFMEACTAAKAHPMRVLEHVFPTKGDSQLTAEDWEVARVCCYLPSDYFQYATNLFEDGVYRGARVAFDWGVTDFDSADTFIAEMKASKKIDGLLAGVK